MISLKEIRGRLSSAPSHAELERLDAEIRQNREHMGKLAAQRRLAGESLNRELDEICNQLDREHPGWRDVQFNASIGKTPIG